VSTRVPSMSSRTACSDGPSNLRAPSVWMELVIRAPPQGTKGPATPSTSGRPVLYRIRQSTAVAVPSPCVEVLRLRVVDDDGVRRLLRVQLELLGELDADPLRLQQLRDLRPVLQVGAG